MLLFECSELSLDDLLFLGLVLNVLILTLDLGQGSLLPVLEVSLVVLRQAVGVHLLELVDGLRVDHDEHRGHPS